ncbi:MAG: methyltransferase domain-containing protein [Thermogemmatispora sp.]|uniref:class I SAM-dependent methyltransferase n=1 Tax=Thermogemmatispora sp. TaxID=1968838 RepID=UPI00262A0C23|nr:class I SAM-dependent methyltransferase [Thermogemmatispora sp.]MBX5457674.1 methyltransferase domain-containing protein [Thermogemmatispora sp.]
MPWWFFRRRGGSALSTGTSWRLGDVALPRLQGRRRYLQEQPYLLPKDLGEVNRLDFQHYMFRAALRGNYLAPIEQPRRILDVGCGTGRWAIELAQQFPQAEVIGVDVEQAKSTSRTPSNYRFVRGDVLQGLPFEENTFDFVHQRLLLLAIPLAAWPGVVQELARVTAPGGWVELLETSISPNDFVPCGPAMQQLLSWMGQLAALRGLDAEGVVMRSLERYLTEAGLVNIQSYPLEGPMGDWGGRLGSLVALDFKEGAKAVSGPIAARFGRSEQEVLAVIEQASQEWNALQTCGRSKVVYGQKPFTG